MTSVSASEGLKFCTGPREMLRKKISLENGNQRDPSCAKYFREKCI